MQIVPYEAWHLMQIVVQPAQGFSGAALQDEKNARELGEAGPCFTALEGTTPLAIAGLVHRGPGRAVAWAVLSSAVLGRFRPIHRAVKRFLDLQDLRRIEMMIDPTKPEAIRWATHLGFQREGTGRAYAPDGRDMDYYSKINRG